MGIYKSRAGGKLLVEHYVSVNLVYGLYFIITLHACIIGIVSCI